MFDHIHETQGLNARSQPIYDAPRGGVLTKPLPFLVELIDHSKIAAVDIFLQASKELDNDATHVFDAGWPSLIKCSSDSCGARWGKVA